ncbi:hypothetical protein Ssed_0146 [Shewanella sediminis HAW-EB3]|uniref:Lipoprotein n=1 Tax=Shewanella sediminis (strain HAW-EB3) TaxID=425104 RepID=A8FPI6_SHESH|nr:hypothetical protein [Shewanella sediminis]ABV34759.1 hypothetical protein Ssed_0146 [Shewanella sediminis HAW-EB3]
MKSIFSIFVLFISLSTLTACATSRPTSITVDDSDRLVEIKVSGNFLEDELRFKSAKYDIRIQNLGDNLFHIDAKVISKRIDHLTGDELIASNQIVTQVKAEPEEKVTIGGLDSWSESIQEDGSVIETRAEKRYVLQIMN